MGKTAQGAVWLNADMRSPYDYWQFWRNAEDADVGRFLRLFTDLPTFEIAIGDLKAGVPLARLAVVAFLATSNGEARRLAQGGGLRLNDVAVSDGAQLLTEADVVDGVIKLAAGKKKIVLVRPI
jgi:tyrosyl-tRNA synthetase